ncbi:unnamed protein product [Nezara viridula]|uniref:Uncharacterized protein n=1 Tax=Nezara viridula TaxID=85310 RepID=A0A9P0MJJ4_NEZVI|nr:unnamed protein product [Nezara viridula]
MSRRSTRDSSPKSRLRMDSYSSSRNGRSKGTPPRTREIDSVMKKARRDGSQSAYWNKKLLEAEEKEPDRWCHSGYKELYHGGEKKSPASSGSDSRSRSGSSSPRTRSPVRPRSPRQKTSKGKSRSPKARSRSPKARSRSPKARTRSPKPRSRSPKARTRSPKVRSRSPKARSRSPKLRSRSPKGRSRSPRGRSRSPRIRSRSPRHRSPRPRSPRVRSPKSSRIRSPRGPRSPRSPRPRSPRSPRSPRQRSPRVRSPRSPRSPRRRRRSPFFRSPVRRPLSPRKTRSPSCSSESSSSCSNDSCSVCAKEARSQTRDRGREHDKRRTETTRQVTRSRSMSLIQSRTLDKSKSKNKNKRVKEKSVLKRDFVGQVSRSHYIKVESDSDSSSGASQPETKGPKLSLSERFGRIAQWSVDRESEHRNLRITAGERLTVEMDSPPSPPYPPNFYCSNNFPYRTDWNACDNCSSIPARPHQSLSNQPPHSLTVRRSLSSIGDLGSWDDVRVRYTYYKEHGYLRDLTLQDYIKWEQWWYKYQDWLDNERYYDR